MASLVATQNRRDIRRMRSDRKRDIAAWRRDVSERMSQRYFPGITPPLILLDYRFWQARRCGWNAISPALRRTGAKDANGRDVLYHAQASPFWLWWSSLHHEHRRQMEALSKLSKSVPALRFPTPLIESLSRDLRAE